MASKFKEIFKNFRVIIYILFLVFALIAIRPNPLKDGVAIRAVIPNSSANVVGIESPRPNSPLTSREVIQSINNRPIENIADYESAIRSLRVNSSIQIKTDRKSYRVVTREKFETIPLNGTEIKEVEEVREVNETVNGTIVTLNKSFIVKKEVPKTMEVSRGLDDLGLRVYNAPKSNIRLGLDLAGGHPFFLVPILHHAVILAVPGVDLPLVGGPVVQAGVLSVPDEEAHFHRLSVQARVVLRRHVGEAELDPVGMDIIKSAVVNDPFQGDIVRHDPASFSICPQFAVILVV